jgi:hypothetical protein
MLLRVRGSTHFQVIVTAAGGRAALNHRLTAVTLPGSFPTQFTVSRPPPSATYHPGGNPPPFVSGIGEECRM